MYLSVLCARTFRGTLTCTCACRFFSGLSVASLILYFVTSSDSGSLVIDCLTSNGNPHPPVFQRVFWSATEGAVAMALLLAGGEDALNALRAVSIIAGVPYTIVICFMCKSLWTILDEEYNKEHGIIPRHYNEWRTGIIDVLDWPTFHAQQARARTSSLFVDCSTCVSSCKRPRACHVRCFECSISRIGFATAVLS